MPTADHLSAFAVASFLLIVVPGPSVLFVVSRGVALGRRAALATVVGNAGGVYAQILLVAVGLGAIVTRSAFVFDAVRVAGAAYLVVLGVQAVRQRRALATVLDVAGTVRSPRSLVRDGFVVGVANPKSIAFFAAILPQFVSPGGAPVPLQMAVLGLVFVAIAVVSDGAWGVAAGSARAWLSRSPERLAALGGAGGLVMIGLGVRLALTGRRD